MKNITSKFCLLCCSVIIMLQAHAQMSQGLVTIGGNGADYGNALIQTTDGGYAIAGQTFSFGDTANGSVYVIKLDASGSVQWTKAIGDTGINTANGIVQARDGGYVIAGSTTDYGAGGSDVYVIKLNATGNVQWTKTYGGPGNDVGNSIVLTNDGGYAIAGNTDSYGAGGDDVYVIKLDSAGNLLWTRTVGGPGDDDANAIIQIPDHSYVIAGSSSSYLSGRNMDEYLVKLDSAGNLKWGKTYGYRNGGGYQDVDNSLTWSSDNTIVVAGSDVNIFSGLNHGSITKFDTSGNVIWNNIMPAGTITIFTASSVIQSKTDKSYIVSAEFYSLTDENYLYVMKVDSNGNDVWYRGIDNLVGGGAGSIINTSDNGFAVTGSATEYSHGSNDVFLLKFNASDSACSPDTIFNRYDTLTMTLDTTGVALSGGSITDSNIGLVTSGSLDSVVCSILLTNVSNIQNLPADVSVYPNPSTGIFSITLSHAVPTAIGIVSAP